MFRGTARSGLIGRLQGAGLDRIPAMMLAAGVYPFSAKDLRKMGSAATEYADFSSPSAEAQKDRATQVAEGYLAGSVSDSQVIEYLASRMV